MWSGVKRNINPRKKNILKKAISHNLKGISQHCHYFNLGLFMGFLFRCSLSTLLTSKGWSWMEVNWPQEKSYSQVASLMLKAHAELKDWRCKGWISVDLCALQSAWESHRHWGALRHVVGHSQLCRDCDQTHLHAPCCLDVAYLGALSWGVPWISLPQMVSIKIRTRKSTIQPFHAVEVMLQDTR